jgi:hypothetical protein
MSHFFFRFSFSFPLFNSTTSKMYDFKEITNLKKKKLQKFMEDNQKRSKVQFPYGLLFPHFVATVPIDRHFTQSKIYKQSRWII